MNLLQDKDRIRIKLRKLKQVLYLYFFPNLVRTDLKSYDIPTFLVKYRASLIRIWNNDVVILCQNKSVVITIQTHLYSWIKFLEKQISTSLPKKFTMKKNKKKICLDQDSNQRSISSLATALPIRPRGVYTNKRKIRNVVKVEMAGLLGVKMPCLML